MAEKVVLEVEYDGKTENVTVRPKTFKEYEKVHKQTFHEYQSNPSATGLYWLAWHTFLLLGKTNEGFDQWMDGLDDVNIAEIGEAHPKETETLTPDITSD